MRTVHIYSGSLALVSKKRGRAGSQTPAGGAGKRRRTRRHRLGLSCRGGTHQHRAAGITLGGTPRPPPGAKGHLVVAILPRRTSATPSPAPTCWRRFSNNGCGCAIIRRTSSLHRRPTQPKNWQVTVCARPSCRFPTAWIPGFLPPTPPAGPSCGKSTAWRRISPWSWAAGHYMQRKGILDFIALARKMPQVQFLWFGYTDPHLVPHNVKAAMADAPENLRFPGFLSQAELRTAYCGADAFLFCSY